MKWFRLAVIFFALSQICAECDEQRPTSDQKMRKEQERMSSQAMQMVGMPAITNFQEKKILKNILELRDTEIKTVTYLVDMNSHLHKLCDSIGYGVPYATQYTNPQRVAGYYESSEHGNVTLPQADPNGLFSPASADGTWVMCFNPETKALSPVYVEPRIVVSPFHLAGG